MKALTDKQRHFMISILAASSLMSLVIVSFLAGAFFTYQQPPARTIYQFTGPLVVEQYPPINCSTQQTTLYAPLYIYSGVPFKTMFCNLQATLWYQLSIEFSSIHTIVDNFTFIPLYHYIEPSTNITYDTFVTDRWTYQHAPLHQQFTNTNIVITLSQRNLTTNSFMHLDTAVSGYVYLGN